MIRLIGKTLKKFSLIYWHTQVKKIYDTIKNFIKNKNYDLSGDLDYNENLFKLFKFDIEKIKLQLNSLNFQYYKPGQSWHYHLFVGLKQYFGNTKINILEIGTFKGDFSNFISKVFSESQITTIDLDEGDYQFIKTYGRDDKERLDKFLKLRNKNLNMNNINFIKLNSLNIKRYFKEKKFDLIWIDGDHLNPQVTIDIINSLDLLDNDGVICTDDVIVDNKSFKYRLVSNEGYLTLKHLEDNGIIKNYYLIKSIHKNNAFRKKYISISTFKNNLKFMDHNG